MPLSGFQSRLSTRRVREVGLPNSGGTHSLDTNHLRYCSCRSRPSGAAGASHYGHPGSCSSCSQRCLASPIVLQGGCCSWLHPTSLPTHAPVQVVCCSRLHPHCCPPPPPHPQPVAAAPALPPPAPGQSPNRGLLLLAPPTVATDSHPCPGWLLPFFRSPSPSAAPPPHTNNHPHTHKNGGSRLHPLSHPAGQGLLLPVPATAATHAAAVPCLLPAATQPP